MRLKMELLLNLNEELIRRLDNHDHDDLGVFVCKASEKEFVAFCNSEKRVLVRLVFRHGDVFAVDYSARIHGRVAGSIQGDLFVQDFTRFCSNETIVFPNAIFVCELDGGIRAARRNVVGPKNPSVIVEVGYCEGLLSLCQTAAIYLGQGTNVQFVIAVKVWKARHNGTRQLLYLHFDRQNLVVIQGVAVPDLAVSFGTGALDDSTIQWLRNHGANNIQGFGLTDAQGQPYPACEQFGMAPYQVAVPASAIFFGAAIPAFAPALYIVDLFRAQETAAECDDPQ